MTAPSPAPAHRKSPPSNAPTAGSSPLHTAGSPPPLLPSLAFDNSSLSTGLSASDAIGSPMKRQRSSLPNTGEADIRKRLGLGIGISDVKADILEQAELANGGAKSAGPREVAGWDTNNVAPGPVAQDGVGMFGGVLGAPHITNPLPSKDQAEEKGKLTQQEPIKQEAGPGVGKQEDMIKQEQMDEDEEL